GHNEISAGELLIYLLQAIVFSWIFQVHRELRKQIDEKQKEIARRAEALEALQHRIEDKRRSIGGRRTKTESRMSNKSEVDAPFDPSKQCLLDIYTMQLWIVFSTLSSWTFSIYL